LAIDKIEILAEPSWWGSSYLEEEKPLEYFGLIAKF
jgi:hypothetical protein